MEWIKVEDRLPEIGVNVFIYESDGMMEIGEYNVDSWIESRECILRDDVTHWMPLPEPPTD